LTGRFEFFSAVLPGNEPLGNILIFLDTDADETFSFGEPFYVSQGITGRYSFSNLEPGTYAVRQHMQPPWRQVVPEASAASLAVPAGLTVLDFGNRATDVVVDLLNAPAAGLVLGEAVPLEFRISNLGSWEATGVRVSVETAILGAILPSAGLVWPEVLIAEAGSNLPPAYWVDVEADEGRSAAMSSFNVSATGFEFVIPPLAAYREDDGDVAVESLRFLFPARVVRTGSGVVQVTASLTQPGMDFNAIDNVDEVATYAREFAPPAVRLQRSFGAVGAVDEAPQMIVLGAEADDLELTVDWPEAHGEAVVLQFNGSLAEEGWRTWPGTVTVEDGRRVVRGLVAELLAQLELETPGKHLFVRLAFLPEQP